MSEADKKRRQAAADARNAAGAGAQKRERTMRIVGALTILVVVIAIVGVALVAKKGSSSDASSSSATASPTADTAAALPQGVLDSSAELAYGVPYGTAPADAPVLAIWEDFQCPACGAVEKANGQGIADLADAGKVQLVWRPTTFLDKNLGNDSSSRAVAAWGCAIDAGKAREYHDAIYANQPEKEGDGYTDEQLLAFAGDAGITGADLDGFTACVKAGTYAGWMENTTSAFYSAGVQGTPYATLNGTEVPIQTLADAAALEKLVADTAAGIAPSAAASASPSAS